MGRREEHHTAVPEVTSSASIGFFTAKDSGPQWSFYRRSLLTRVVTNSTSYQLHCQQNKTVQQNKMACSYLSKVLFMVCIIEVKV